MSDVWCEPLPEKCPPNDAHEPNGQSLFRLVATTPPTAEDFKSHRLLFPSKPFNVDECEVRSLSLSATLEDAVNKTKFGRFKGFSIAQITLTKGSGLIKQTGKANHWSWWRVASFDPLSQYKIVEE